MVDALVEHGAGHGPGHDVARRQLVHEPLAPGVAEQGAVAAEGLGQQGPGHLGVVEGGGVELDELQVGYGHAGPQGHGHPVAGGLRRVGGDGVELAEAARGQQRVPGPDLPHHARRVDGHHAPAPPPLDDQVEGEPLLHHRRGGGLDRLHQRPLDLHAGGGPAGVHDPRHRVATLPGQGQLAVGVPVEHRPEGDQVLDPRRPLVDEHPHRIGVAQAGAGGQGVGPVQVGGVGVAAEHRGHAALGPTGGRLVEVALGEHADPQAGIAVGGDGGRLHRGRKPGDAAAQDQEIEQWVLRPAGCRRRP